jgi:hypothetical protein
MIPLYTALTDDTGFWPEELGGRIVDHAASKFPMSGDPDEPSDSPPRPRTRSKSITTVGVQDPNDQSLPAGPRTRTRSISIGSLREATKSRVKTKELPPSPDKTRLVIELDDPKELIGFLQQIISSLQDGKRKRITLVVDD